MEGEKHLAAVICLPREPRDAGVPTTRQLLERAGATMSPAAGLAPDPVPCTWGGLDCLACSKSTDLYYILEIYFWQTDLIRLRVRNDKEGRESLTEDLTLPLVLAFRDACEALQAEVAFIVTHLDQAERRYLDLEEENLVMGGAAYFLHCRFGLLYLDESECRQLKPFPPLEGRDTLPAPHGLLVFGGKGTKRWL